MPITVEFFGIARRRAGIERLQIDADTLGAALDVLADHLPTWAESCLDDGELTGAYLSSRNGMQFLTDRDDRLNDGDSLLILSADVGG